MYKTTLLSKISNLIFIVCASFVLSFIWINYTTHNPSTSLMSSIIITLTTSITYILLNKLIAHRNKQLKTLNSKLENTKIQLLYGNLKKNIDVILNAFDLSTDNKINNNHYIDSFNNDVFFIFE